MLFFIPTVFFIYICKYDKNGAMYVKYISAVNYLTYVAIYKLL
jgi:hypothetical protein